MAATWHILLVDDHEAVRRGLAQLLFNLTKSGFVVNVHEADSLATARASLAQRMPDLLVLDVELGQENGLELLPTVAQRCHVAVLTSHPSSALCTSAFRQGARLVLGKSEPAAQVLAQLNGLLTGTAPYLRG